MQIPSVGVGSAFGMLLTLLSPAPRQQAQKKQDDAPPTLIWIATGTLFEACSCSVPCPCNFRQRPTHGSCNTIYLYHLKSARFGSIALDGLMFAGGEADKDPMGYLDSKAVGPQREALKKLALAVFEKGGPSPGERKFVFVDLKSKQSPSHFSAAFGESGGFEADIIFGRDNKSPIVVENNVTWPVKRFTKGVTTSFDYKDANGNVLKYDGVNANVGDFDLKP